MMMMMVGNTFTTHTHRTRAAPLLRGIAACTIIIIIIIIIILILIIIVMMIIISSNIKSKIILTLHFCYHYLQKPQSVVAVGVTVMGIGGWSLFGPSFQPSTSSRVWAGSRTNIWTHFQKNIYNINYFWAILSEPEFSDGIQDSNQEKGGRGGALLGTIQIIAHIQIATLMQSNAVNAQ